MQLLPYTKALTDKSATEPLEPEEEVALAEMALLSGVPLSNTAIRAFLQKISNTTLTGLIQEYEQNT